MFTVIGFILAGLISLGLVLLLRHIASRENPTLAVFVPAQMHALVTTKSNKITDVTKGGGNVVDVVHSIPGKILNDSDPDHMNWFYEDGKEPRGVLYHLFGIEIIGFFRYLRLNDVRTFRWGRMDNENEYHMQAKNLQTRYVFFSGQHDMDFKGVESGAMLKLDLRFNIVYEEKYPVRVRLRTADPYAVLTMMVNRLVISLVGSTEDPKMLVSDKQLQAAMAKSIQDEVSVEVLKQLGIEIKFVNLTEIDFDANTKRLLELEATTNLENKARVSVAQNAKEVQILANDADADRIERVIKPAAENDRTVRVREAEAYERNKVVTVYAPGAKTMLPLSPPAK